MAHHGPDDPPLPIGAKAYLAAFDRYLAAVKAGIGSERREARAEMRDRLDAMLAVNEDEIDVDLADAGHEKARSNRRAA